MKVVINKCFGGFGLSPAALLRLYELQCPDLELHDVDSYYGKRDDDSILGKKAALEGWRQHLKGDGKFSVFLTVFTPDEKHVINTPYGDDFRKSPMLLQVLEELGPLANGMCANLVAVEVPDGVDYVISEYDGSEHIAERHQTWS